MTKALPDREHRTTAEAGAHVPEQRDAAAEQYAADAELGRALREWHERSQAAQSAHGIAAAADWRRVAMVPSRDQLAQRRAEFGPRYQPIESLDREAMARWVETGSSQPERAAEAEQEPGLQL